MAVRGGADVRELQRFAQRIKSVPLDVQAAAKDAIEKTAKAMVKRAKVIAPIGDDRNGHLRDTIQMRAGSPTNFEQIVEVGNDALPYAAALEFGHRTKSGHHVPGNPWFIPLTRVINKQHRNRMRRAVRKALKKTFPGA